MIKSAAVIGTGNVAYHMLRGFRSLNIDNVVVWGRDAHKREMLARKFGYNAVENMEDINSATQLCIICVSDEAIPVIVEKLNMLNGVVCHTSGSTSIDIVANMFPHAGVLWPLQSLSAYHDISFENIPLCIEASDEKSRKLLIYFTELLTGKYVETTSEQRLLLHIAAVMVSNFSNHLAALAKSLLHDQQLSFDLLKPLIRETAEKLQRLDPVDAQTGPSARNDIKTEEKHIKRLDNTKKIQELYRHFSQSIKLFHNKA
ncbi:MAG: DUF2520 domain-containing protein [Bacteroidales bacterium]|nr:DUF2520 domain-containing protein [Bacteroidales bacterium]